MKKLVAAIIVIAVLSGDKVRDQGSGREITIPQ
jgi:hypothetical protein